MRPSQTWGDKLPKGGGENLKAWNRQKPGTALVDDTGRGAPELPRWAGDGAKRPARGSAFLWLGQSDPQLSSLGSTAGFRVPLATKNHSNRNSWHFCCVKRCLGFESTEIIPFHDHCSPGHCLIERRQGRQKTTEALLSLHRQKGWELTWTQKSWLGGLIT